MLLAPGKQTQECSMRASHRHRSAENRQQSSATGSEPPARPREVHPSPLATNRLGQLHPEPLAPVPPRDRLQILDSRLEIEKQIGSCLSADCPPSATANLQSQICNRAQTGPVRPGTIPGLHRGSILLAATGLQGFPERGRDTGSGHGHTSWENLEPRITFAQGRAVDDSPQSTRFSPECTDSSGDSGRFSFALLSHGKV
jgi:hypothetical protein